MIVALFIGLIVIAAVLFKPRLASLGFPFWYALFPKGFVLLDVAGIPVVTMYRAACIALLVSVGARALTRRENWLTSSPLSIPLFIVLFSCLITMVANITNENAGPLRVFNFFNEIIVPTTAFCYHFSKESSEFQQSLFRKIFIFYGAIALYASIAFLIQFNPYIEFLKSTNETGRIVVQTYEGSYRGLRAQGTISHPITFGAAIVIVLLSCFAIGNAKRWLGRSPTAGWLGIAAGIAILAAVMFTRSRSPLILLGVAVILMLLLSTLWRTYLYIMFGSLAAVLAFLLIPQVQTSALSVANIFVTSMGQDQKGSSLDMRVKQWSISSKYFATSPVFGNGLDATENIVASKNEPDLFDAESIIYVVMIDQGLLGILAYLTFFIWTFAIGFKYILSRNDWAIYSGLVIGYLVFVMSTGVMETMPIFCCMISAILLRWKKAISGQ